MRYETTLSIPADATSDAHVTPSKDASSAIDALTITNG